MLPRSRRQQGSSQSYSTGNTVISLTHATPTYDSSNGTLAESDPDFNPKTISHQRLSSTPVDATRAGFDDYGSELGKDARVWSAYVKEAEQWDDEMVDGWNRSLDVMLVNWVAVTVFAALFSAVSTTFVVESIKDLQPDPAMISATTLQEISQVLRIIVSNNQSSASLSDLPPEEKFKPSAAAIWVNVLWFLSLALSVSVSLVTMLAKQWCYSFMSGRAGQPHVQARTRQRRLEELERWKMPEILAILPVFMHLSLFLFFTGLILYLWDTHVGVAIPVLATTAFTGTFYATTTMLPITYELCPYATPLSQFIKTCPNALEFLKQTFSTILSQASHLKIPMRLLKLFDSFSLAEPEAPTKALGWLMSNSQDTRSVDIALQSIAGADRRLPKPLLDCGAHRLISQRFRNCFLSHPQSGFSYLSNPTLLDAASLYGRALEFFMADPGYMSRVEAVLLQPAFNTTTPALAQYCCIRTCWGKHMVGGAASYWPALPGSSPRSTCFLRRHADGESVLHPTALVALIDTVAEESQHWMRKLRSRERAQYPIYLLRLLDQMDQLSLSHARPAIAVCLTSIAVAFDGFDSVDETVPSVGPQSPGHRLLNYYASSNNRNRDVEPLLVYGLLGLLRDRRIHEFTEGELLVIAQQLVAVNELRPPPSTQHLPFILPPLNLGTLAIETLLPALSPEAQDLVNAKDARGRLFQALLPYSYMWGSHSAEIYSIVAESIRLPNCDHLKQIWKRWLSSQWTSYYASEMLPLLERHRTFPHVLHLIATPESLEYSAIPYAMAHFWSLVNHIVVWNRRWGTQYGHGPFGKVLSSIVSQLCEAIKTGKVDSIKSSQGMTLLSLLMYQAEVWLPQLECLANQVPADVLNSGILTLLSESYTSNHLAQRVESILNICNSHTETTM
ncbi:activating signal cointegrator 1 complex subunit 3 [Rhizoctonia solani]|uniref:Activating signal cointegrator 1 complex subunit 3 n=1 Tax=Rhizoctonia solani TaxID=456999 RepID=A0A8H8P047_9AGAM|nr:activating signal cointegrator 1 complex subunit 3 [Rhizoctonia solani]QRW21257.1 activating signal cointegrator 1 complex subunit 3 [Rhizoctonia solani]